MQNNAVEGRRKKGSDWRGEEIIEWFQMVREKYGRILQERSDSIKEDAELNQLLCKITNKMTEERKY